MANPCPPWPSGFPRSPDHSWNITVEVTWPDGYDWDADFIPGPWPDFPWFEGTKRVQDYMQRWTVASPVEEVRIDVSAGGQPRGSMRLGFYAAWYGDARPDGVPPVGDGTLPDHMNFTVGNCAVPGQLWPEDYAYASWLWAKTKLNEGLYVPDAGHIGMTVVGTASWLTFSGERVEVSPNYPDPPDVQILGAVADQPPEVGEIEPTGPA